jgi:triphosphatase
MHTPIDPEIELKLLVADGADMIIQQQLVPALSGTVEVSKLILANYYYDSPQRDLRKHDIGFRIRTNNGSIEQTIKTRGTMIGGLHQRPEFNIALEQALPMLELFAKDIWPQDLSVTELQKQLRLMFTTNFTRHVYLLTLPDDTQVELVWDKGEIAAKQQILPLCELELELKRGKPEHLFSLARHIAQLMPVRIGNASKAARGYMLVDGLEIKLLPMPETLNIEQHANVENAFIQAMEFALGYWQHHEALYHITPSANTLRAMSKGMELVLTTLSVYQEALYWDGLTDVQDALLIWLAKWTWVEDLYHLSRLSSETDEKIINFAKKPTLVNRLKDKTEALIAQNQPLSLLSNPKNILLQLDIAQALFAKPWRQESEGYLITNQVFAKQYVLNNKSTALTNTISTQLCSVQDYIYHAGDIEHQQQLNFLLATVSTTNAQAKSQLWQEIGRGLDELRLVVLLQEEAANIDMEDKDKVLRWCAERITILLGAMEGSRNKTSVLMSQE